MITQANWRKYINRLSAIDKKAADLMQAYIDEHGLDDGEALIQYAYALVTKYGETSATLASEMYDHMAELMDAGVPEAIPAETATLKEVAKGVTWGKYHSPSQIPSVVSRQVRQAGADTVIQNAKRDKAQWAWIPQGDTCAFCITLASRGWQDASKTVLKGNHAEHVHANCDCTFAIAFKLADRRLYDSIYDPAKYKELYYQSEGGTPKDKINALRRQHYKKNKDKINVQKREAYEIRKEEAREKENYTSRIISDDSLKNLNFAINDDMMPSDQYYMPKKKISEFLLKPGAKHSKEFFDVGYTENDSTLLNADIYNQFDQNKASDVRILNDGSIRFSIKMQLGVIKKRSFRTVWQIDANSDKPRFITAYREDG